VPAPNVTPSARPSRHLVLWVMSCAQRRLRLLRRSSLALSSCLTRSEVAPSAAERQQNRLVRGSPCSANHPKRTPAGHPAASRNASDDAGTPRNASTALLQRIFTGAQRFVDLRVRARKPAIPGRSQAALGGERIQPRQVRRAPSYSSAAVRSPQRSLRSGSVPLPQQRVQLVQ